MHKRHRVCTKYAQNRNKIGTKQRRISFTKKNKTNDNANAKISGCICVHNVVLYERKTDWSVNNERVKCFRI